MRCPECGAEIRLAGIMSEPFEYYTEENSLEIPHNLPTVLFTITSAECTECSWETSFADDPIEVKEIREVINAVEEAIK